MSKKGLLPQSSRHVLIYDEDWEFLDRYYGKYSPSRLGPGGAIKHIVHKKVKELREKQSELMNNIIKPTGKPADDRPDDTAVERPE